MEFPNKRHTLQIIKPYVMCLNIYSSQPQLKSIPYFQPNIHSFTPSINPSTIKEKIIMHSEEQIEVILSKLLAFNESNFQLGFLVGFNVYNLSRDEDEKRLLVVSSIHPPEHSILNHFNSVSIIITIIVLNSTA